MLSYMILMYLDNGKPIKSDVWLCSQGTVLNRRKTNRWKQKKKKELNNVVRKCLSYLFVTIFFQLSWIIVGAKILVLFFPFTIMTRQCWLLTVASLVCIGITLSAAKPRLLIVSLDGMEENHIYFLWFYWLPRSAPFIFQVFDMSI